MHPSHNRNARGRRVDLLVYIAAIAALALTLLIAHAPLARAATTHHRRDCAGAAARGHTRSARSCRRRKTRAQRRRAKARARVRTRTRTLRTHRLRTIKSAAEASEAISASIAEVLASPCANTELTPEAANLALVRAATLCLINHKRAENGERPLIANAALEAAAESHAAELIAEDYFAHVSPSGETPVQRITNMGYLPSPDDGYVLGENLAWGTYELSTAQSIANAWFASPPHLANILESQYRETGIGVAAAVPASLAGGAPGATYAQEFGVVLR